MMASLHRVKGHDSHLELEAITIPGFFFIKKNGRNLEGVQTGRNLDPVHIWILPKASCF